MRMVLPVDDSTKTNEPRDLFNSNYWTGILFLKPPNPLKTSPLVARAKPPKKTASLGRLLGIQAHQQERVLCLRLERERSLTTTAEAGRIASPSTDKARNRLSSGTSKIRPTYQMW